jgi:hypothetical protein
MIAPLTEFFDRIYVINLPERRDRRSNMMHELAQVCVREGDPQLEIFPAVKVTDAEGFPGLGARGCFLSHLAILRAARDAKLKNLLILEDDLAFSPFFVKHQTTVLNQLCEQPWQIVYFGHILPLSPLPKGEFVWHLTQASLQTTHFLAINGEVIPQVVDFLELVLSRPAGHPLGGPMHVDGAYSTFRAQHPDVKTLLANPSLGFQRSSPSDVAGLRWFDKVPGLRQMASVGRAIQTEYQKRRLS